MKRQLNLIVNGKGGVGKSFFAVNFVQFLKDREISFVACDSDNENSTLKRFHPDAQFTSLTDPRAVDDVFRALERVGFVVMDCRAASTEFFLRYFSTIDLGQVLRLLKARLTLLMPVNHEADSVDQIQRWVEAPRIAASYVVIRNFPGWTLLCPSRTNSGPMTEACVVQGRRIEPAEFVQVRELVSGHPEWSRYRLSRELCALWDWRTRTGGLKDMAARTLLGKFAERGWIELPKCRACSPNRHRLAPPPERAWDQTPLACSLAALGDVQITEVSSRSEERTRARSGLSAFHYLGYRAPVGESLQYVVRDGSGRWLAVLVFGAAAWKCAGRDRWIGWERAQRERNLERVANNSRFLIFPWVQVPHLASHILGRIARRIGADWQRKYGHPVVLLESFVEREHFAGTCYRAANWARVGATTGRSRQDRDRALSVPVKEIYLYPLQRNFRQELAA